MNTGSLQQYLLSQAGVVTHFETTSTHPIVTISRETGSGGSAFAEALADYLNERNADSEIPWVVFDRNLVERTLEEHRIPKEVGKYMPEDSPSLLKATLEEMLGLHPDSWSLVEKMRATIQKLASRGHVIFVGRAAHLVTSSFEYALHLRLVAPFDRRVRAIRKHLSLSNEQAAAHVKETDKARARYVYSHYNVKVEDPCLYHLILNTDRIPLDKAVMMVGEAVLDMETAGVTH